VEFLCAAQGFDSLRPLKPGRGVADLYRRIRADHPPIEPLDADRPPAPDIEQLAARLAEGSLDPRAYLPSEG